MSVTGKRVGSQTGSRSERAKKKISCILIAALTSSSLCLGGCSRAELTGGRQEETLALIDCDSAAVSVSQTFTVPAGQQGVLTADYRQEGGAAGIVILKGDEEVASLDIPESSEYSEKSSDGELESGCGKIETVLECGVYTVRVEAGEYRGRLRCVLERRLKKPDAGMLAEEGGAAGWGRDWLVLCTGKKV